MNDSPSIGRSEVSIAVDADRLVRGQMCVVPGPDVQHARLGRGLRSIAVDRNLIIAEEMLRWSAPVQEAADGLDDQPREPVSVAP